MFIFGKNGMLGKSSAKLMIVLCLLCLLAQPACEDEEADDSESSSGPAPEDDDNDAVADDDDDDDNNDDDNDDDDDDNDDNDLTPPDMLKVMTFNLRTGMALDGENSWIYRKEIVRDLLSQERPAVMGTQEGWFFQLQYIRENVPGYEWEGEARLGLGVDEYCAVFYRVEVFELLDTGTFWLSDTPEAPRSVFSENQLCPRIVTWVELQAKADGFHFFEFNTHFDTTDLDEVPQRSAALLVRQIAAIAGEAPVIVTGDFNELVGSEAYQILTGALVYEGVTGALIDPWVALDLPEEGSSHSFTGVSPSPSRIDWVLTSADFTPLAGEVSHYEQDGHYPSDHFPVIVEFAWPE